MNRWSLQSVIARNDEEFFYCTSCETRQPYDDSGFLDGCDNESCRACAKCYAAHLEEVAERIAEEGE